MEGIPFNMIQTFLVILDIDFIFWQRMMNHKGSQAEKRYHDKAQKRIEKKDTSPR